MKLPKTLTNIREILTQPALLEEQVTGSQTEFSLAFLEQYTNN